MSAPMSVIRGLADSIRSLQQSLLKARSPLRLPPFRFGMLGNESDLSGFYRDSMRGSARQLDLIVHNLVRFAQIIPLSLVHYTRA